LLALEEERLQSDGRSATTFVDNTEQIVREYEHPTTFVDNADQSVREYETAPFVVVNTISDALPEAFRFSTTGGGHGRISPANASTSACSLDPHSNSTAIPEFDVELPVSRSEQIQLMRTYLQEAGTWCEATDSDRHFTILYVHKLMDNKPFEAAAMALASRQIDAVRRRPRQSSLSLYQHAVQSLLHYEPSQCGEATLACCVLLSIYEMMTSEVGEWRRHLKVGISKRNYILV
jgi:hypothetical protein